MKSCVAVVTALMLSVIKMTAQSESATLDLGLPTDNDAIYRGDGPAFYQYVDRDYQGEKSTPWEGGQYGFVRNPLATGSGFIYTKFHEGLDIRPVHRDANNEPLDEVRAIAPGKVEHTNHVAGYSNYGRYVVVEHRWDGSDYYSLYGHLNSIAVKPGQKVEKGSALGVLGYTGVGINRERAHLHLELNLMMNPRFERWHDANFAKSDPNHNGIYNGLNLAGLNIARLYLALRKNPALTIPEFLGDEETYYKVTLPRSRHLAIKKLYPWMVRGTTGVKTSSWEISFARTGVPLQIQGSDQQVRQPEISYIKKSSVNYTNLTRGDVAGTSGRARLTDAGMRAMRLLIYPD